MVEPVVTGTNVSCVPKNFDTHIVQKNKLPGIFGNITVMKIILLLSSATLMSPGQDETRVFGYVRSEFIH